MSSMCLRVGKNTFLEMTTDNVPDIDLFQRSASIFGYIFSDIILMFIHFTVRYHFYLYRMTNRKLK